ncbi:MAG: alpha/beta hydrolase-fold protein, partial [Planctomycetota bacterium]
MVLALAPAPTRAQETYPVHPDAVTKTDVPRGTVEKFRFADSKVFPGTVRDVALYIPAQYKSAQDRSAKDKSTKPAAVMVFQDGLKYIRKNSPWALPTVFDNLIARGEMPVTIAICINPGIVPGGQNAQDRFNRSFEYDSVSDRYARFVVDEILPKVAEKYTLTDDPNMRGIGGSSSGAIAAFGVAWHRPDAFRRVFSTVGTFVGLRGGNEYPTLIRKTEPKPLRVFLQDGSNDLDIYGGSWWNANLTMLSALQWGGYSVQHVWGQGGHNGKHGAAIFPDAMKWLWQDFDQPIAAPKIQGQVEWSKWLVDGQDWVRAGAAKVAMDDSGASVRVGDRTYDLSDSPPVVPSNPAAAVATPDRRFILVAFDDQRHVWSLRISDNGSLVDAQPYGYLHTPQTELRTGVTAATMTIDGKALFATTMGIQCFDQPGRVHLIIDSPVP